MKLFQITRDEVGGVDAAGVADPGSVTSRNDFVYEEIACERSIISKIGALRGKSRKAQFINKLVDLNR